MNIARFQFEVFSVILIIGIPQIVNNQILLGKF